MARTLLDTARRCGAEHASNRRRTRAARTAARTVPRAHRAGADRSRYDIAIGRADRRGGVDWRRRFRSAFADAAADRRIARLGHGANGRTALRRHRGVSTKALNGKREDDVQAAIITGVSRGLGEAIAVDLLSRGWDVLGVGRKSSECLSGERYRFVEIDLADVVRIDEALSARFNEIAQSRPSSVACINNAAVA